jgi:predicted Zn-dependent protease
MLVYYGIANYNTGEVVGNIAQGVGKMVYFSYSRDQEREADDIGLDYMTKAGFNPQGGSRLWKKSIADAGVGKFSFKNTHPLSDERLGNINEKIKLSHPDFIEKEFEQYRISRELASCCTLASGVVFSESAPSIRDTYERKPTQYGPADCLLDGKVVRMPKIQCIRDNGELVR